MGNRVVVMRENFTPTAGNDAITYISAAGRRARVVELLMSGIGTTSASQAVRITRSTAGTTPGGAIVPSKFDHSEQPSPVGTTATTWSVQPTPETNGTDVSWNALGQSMPWRPPVAGGNKGAYEVRNGECISVRALSGITFQACNLTLVIEED
jgi:hypothetical protein